jgi:DNA-binding NarL/FixJ family response regulator
MLEGSAEQNGVRVVVAHQHELLAEALARLLNNLGLTVVGSQCDSAALLDHLPTAAADVLVLDAGFDPAAGFLVALERVRAAAPEVRIVVLTAAPDEMLSLAARERDLDGVVHTSTAGVELAATIAQVVAGHAVFPAGWLHPSAARGTSSERGDTPMADNKPRRGRSPARSGNARHLEGDTGDADVSQRAKDGKADARSNRICRSAWSQGAAPARSGAAGVPRV